MGKMEPAYLVSSQGNGRSHQELVAASSHESKPEEITLTS